MNMNLSEPLSPHAAFKGDRTNASRLYYKIQPGEKIMHYDIVSLYVSVNKKDEYPLGHPLIILSGFGDIKSYFGLIYCKVLPPDEYLYPVLPTTTNGKLVFTLCRRCAEERIQTYCSHGNDDRSYEGVFVSPELHHAVDVGYRVVEIYEIWHWKESKVGLFSEYIDKFLKKKPRRVVDQQLVRRMNKKTHILQMLKNEKELFWKKAK